MVIPVMWIIAKCVHIQISAAYATPITCSSSTVQHLNSLAYPSLATSRIVPTATKTTSVLLVVADSMSPPMAAA